jgi:orotidine-5'-phosphate decarboxylase
MHPFLEKLKENKKRTGNTLCVGLDPDPEKMPDFFPKTAHGIKEFLIEIIEATQEHCIAYKPNISFFEAFGLEGLKVLESLCHRIDSRIPIIIDGKRGDIGNTAKMQAKYMFDYFGADACTVNPYMGEDSVLPFLNYKDNYTFILTLTSNKGSHDFEKKKLTNDTFFYEEVLSRCIAWNNKFQNAGVVVGATQAELISIRKKDPSLLFLIPGVGAQGGSYSYAYENGGNNEGLSLINIGRSILYCDPTFTDTKNVIKNVIQKLIKE